MYTVEDYIKYFKDISFDEYKFNDLDNILFSLLVYIPFEFTNKNNITIYEMYNEYVKVKPTIREELNVVEKKAFRLLKEIYKSKRYKDIFICDIKSILNDKVQFAAMIFRGKTLTYVAYRGTDSSLVGWQENINLLLPYPSSTQILAINYLKENIKPRDKNIYVGGHSKGGNLAMASVMDTSSNIFKRIINVYNNDGPGFLEKEFLSDKYKMLSSVLINILPEESTIGILMNNENYTYVKSKGIGFDQHDLSKWNCFGPFLVKSRLSNFSTKLKYRIDNWLKTTNEDSLQKVVKGICQALDELDINYIKDIKFNDIINLIKKSDRIDDKTKKLLLDNLKDIFIKDVSKV